MTWTEKLPPAFAWLGSDEWKFFVLPDVLFAVIAIAFLVVFG